MSKSTGRSTGPATVVEKEVKAGGHVLLWIGLAIAAVMVAGPHFGEWFTNQAANAGVNTAKGIVKGTAKSAAEVCGPGGINHAETYLCALPDPTNGVPRGDGPWRTTPTSAAPAPAPPKPQPYGAPNGPIKPLPSVTPAAPKPQIGPAPDEPVLSGPPPGGILGELPGVGQVINELGPALKALNP